jgi:hypothetical protein
MEREMAFYLQHEPSGLLAHKLSTGEHDHAKVNHPSDAARFDTWGAASDFSQNFGPDWQIEEV